MTEIHRFQSKQEETIMPVTPSIRIFRAVIVAIADSFKLVGGAISPRA
jgi:hypothetical protein